MGESYASTCTSVVCTEALSAALAAERLAAEERIRDEIERQTITSDYIDGLRKYILLLTILF